MFQRQGFLHLCRNFAELLQNEETRTGQEGKRPTEDVIRSDLFILSPEIQ